MVSFVSGLVLVIINSAIILQLIDQIFDTDQSIIVKALFVLIILLCFILVILGINLMWAPVKRSGSNVLESIGDIIDFSDFGGGGD